MNSVSRLNHLIAPHAEDQLNLGKNNPRAWTTTSENAFWLVVATVPQEGATVLFNKVTTFVLGVDPFSGSMTVLRWTCTCTCNFFLTQSRSNPCSIDPWHVTSGVPTARWVGNVYTNSDCIQGLDLNLTLCWSISLDSSPSLALFCIIWCPDVKWNKHIFNSL